MRIIKVDPDSRVMSEEEVRALLARTNLVRVSLVDGDGWPSVYPLWYVFEDDILRISSGAESRKVRLARALPKAGWCVDEGSGAGDDRPRGVRGRADVHVVADDVPAAVDLMKKLLIKYMGSLDGEMQRSFLDSAENNETVVLELTPHAFGGWAY